jgi:hypothetical protein
MAIVSLKVLESDVTHLISPVLTMLIPLSYVEIGSAVNPAALAGSGIDLDT